MTDKEIFIYYILPLLILLAAMVTTGLIVFEGVLEFWTYQDP
ncbi:MAG: hypothetical protein QNJ38_02460 [Prochloraceae cyanobacterium]|nr:hypothetical protein [Prochloraceae cyanobacterium]